MTDTDILSNPCFVNIRTGYRSRFWVELKHFSLCRSLIVVEQPDVLEIHSNEHRRDLPIGDDIFMKTINQIHQISLDRLLVKREGYGWTDWVMI